jgi:hypothetical protein
MRIPGEDIWSDFEHHVVAAIVRLRLRNHQDERRLIGHAVVDRDHGSIGDCEHVLAKAVILLYRLAVAVEDSVMSDLDQVYREGFSRYDAGAVNRDAFVPVNVGLAASGAREPAVPPDRRPDHDRGLMVDGDFGRINLRRVGQ